jgi:teichuronic acid biosynthesis glycosyltransferase TuaH
MANLSALFLAANTSWVYALANAFSIHHFVHVTRFYDLLNYYRLKPEWPKHDQSLRLKRFIQVLPSGYAGQFELLFRPYLQIKIQSWCNQLEHLSKASPWIIAPYPYLVPWVRHVPNQRLIYYHLDEYIFYQLERKAKILAQEAELIDRAAITLCIAQHQVEVLQQRYPHKTDTIFHFPLGVLDTFINPLPQAVSEPMTVGYVGNLIERVDWQLVYKVAQACPDITFVFVGGLSDYASVIYTPNWKDQREAVLSLPNVRHIGSVPQHEVVKYYWSFGVNWIPYDIHHPFNQASCPTKIMDGIASARPVISTDIPECRLYPDWITIFHSAEEAVQVIHDNLTASDTLASLQKREEQRHFAIQQTWQQRANTLCHWLIS